MSITSMTFWPEWRYICHSCGYKYPISNNVYNPKMGGIAFQPIIFADCCKDINLKLHNLLEPCKLCLP